MLESTTKKEARKRTGEEMLDTIIRRSHLHWFRHVERLGLGQLVHQALRFTYILKLRTQGH